MRYERHYRRRKKNSAFNIILISIIVIAVLVISYCAYRLIIINNTYKESRTAYSSIEEEVFETEEETTTDDFKTITDTTKTKSKFNFDKLKTQCYYPEDCKGYIVQAGVMAYPILQGPDNTRYVRAMFTDMSYSVNGSIFIDCRFPEGLEGNYCIIYGHDINDGSMFGSLLNYDDEEYYKKHKTFTIYTEDNEYTYKVAAQMVVSVDSDAYKTAFNDSDDFVNTMNDLLSERTYATDVDSIKEDDHVIMLSTCVRWKDYSLRRVVMLVRDTTKTNAETTTDTKAETVTTKAETK